MATKAELEEGIRRADKAGDRAAVQALGRELERTYPKPDNSRFRGFILGAEKALDNAATFVGKIPLPGSTRTVGQASDDFARLVGMNTTAQAAQHFDAARANNTRKGYQLAGNIAGTLPTMALPGGILTQSAAAGALLTDNPNDAWGTARDAAIGLASGKAGQLAGEYIAAPIASRIARTAPAQAVKRVVGNAAAPVVDAVKSRIPALANAPRLPQRAAPAAPAPTRPLAPLGREAEVRAARFARVGVRNPTSGMVTRDPAVWNFERQAAKDLANGQPLQDAFRAVDEDLGNAVRGTIDKAGGSIGREVTGQRVTDALAAKNKQMQTEISAAYKAAREAKGDFTVGRLDDFHNALNDPELVDNSVFDAMTNDVSKRLHRYGIVGEDGELRGMTLKQAEELRKFIGKLGSDADPTTRLARQRLIDGLDESVANGNYGDVFAQPRAMARARFEEFKKTMPGKLADEGIAPERVVPRLLQQGTSLNDLRAVKSSLLTGQGRDAWHAVRGQALDDIFSPAISQDGAINGGMIFRNFNKHAEKLRVLLEPDEYKSVRSMALAARDATADVPRSYVNHSNTASTLGNMFADQAASKRFLPGFVTRNAPRMASAGLGGFAGGPAGAALGDAAMTGVQSIAAARASAAAAKAMSEKVGMALDPSALAAQGQILTQREIEEALRRQALQRGQNFYGGVIGRAAGPAAVSLFSGSRP